MIHYVLILIIIFFFIRKIFGTNILRVLKIVQLKNLFSFLSNITVITYKVPAIDFINYKSLNSLNKPQVFSDVYVEYKISTINTRYNKILDNYNNTFKINKNTRYYKNKFKDLKEYYMD